MEEVIMELILISVLTIIAMCLGVFVGRLWGEEVGYSAGQEIGYLEGLEDSSQALQNAMDFPTTLDGKFFSTDAALRDISLRDREGDR